jgi:hypothetical protein
MQKNLIQGGKYMAQCQQPCDATVAKPFSNWHNPVLEDQGVKLTPKKN